MNINKRITVLGLAALVLGTWSVQSYAASTGCSDGATQVSATAEAMFLSQYASGVTISDLTGTGPGAATATDTTQTIAHYSDLLAKNKKGPDVNGNGILCVKTYDGYGQNKASFWVHFSDDGGGSTSKWFE